ncbi:MAG: SCO family protein [Gemmatimonadota bacterium]
MSRRLARFARAATPVVVVLVLAAGCRMEAPERADAAAREADTGLRGLVMPDRSSRPDFVLADARGGDFDFRARTDGYLTLLFFGYTHCPDVCPIHMSSIAEVKRDLGAELSRRIRVVFVTVDPARDTPQRLRDWLGGFDSEFVGLYGEPEAVDAIQLELGLPPAIVPDTAAADYMVGHGSPVLAFTADDSLIVRYPFGTRQEDWRHDLPILAGR